MFQTAWNVLQERQKREQYENERYEEYQKKIKEYQNLLSLDPIHQFVDKEFVYFIKSRERDVVKIGYSVSLPSRVMAINRLFPEGCVVVGIIPGGRLREGEVHKKFHSVYLKGSFEMFEYTDSVRYFILENMTDVERELIKILNERVLFLDNEITPYIAVESWAGITKTKCEVLGQTKRRFKVKLFDSAKLPNGTVGRPGDIILVPKHAVRFPNGGNYAKEDV